MNGEGGGFKLFMLSILYWIIETWWMDLECIFLEPIIELGSWIQQQHSTLESSRSEVEFKEFKSRLKSAKTRFKLSGGLNLK